MAQRLLNLVNAAMQNSPLKRSQQPQRTLCTWMSVPWSRLESDRWGVDMPKKHVACRHLCKATSVWRSTADACAQWPQATDAHSLTPRCHASRALPSMEQKGLVGGCSVPVCLSRPSPEQLLRPRPGWCCKEEHCADRPRVCMNHGLASSQAAAASFPLTEKLQSSLRTQC